jgi:hypothetical protein
VGEVARLLTGAAYHPRGIKVMLTTGQVGRVRRFAAEEDGGNEGAAIGGGVGAAGVDAGARRADGREGQTRQGRLGAGPGREGASGAARPEASSHDAAPGGTGRQSRGGLRGGREQGQRRGEFKGEARAALDARSGGGGGGGEAASEAQASHAELRDLMGHFRKL